VKIQDHYDWIVIGSHPAGLLSASLVARLGLSVLILPFAQHFGLYSGSNGELIDTESNYLVGLAHGKVGKVEGLISSCLSRVGILPAEKDLIDAETPTPQVLTPSVRLSMVQSDQLSYELQRELGKANAKQLGLVNALKHTEADYLAFWLNLPKRLTLSSNRKPSSVEPMTLKHLQTKLSNNLKLEDATLVNWSSRKKFVSELSSNGVDFKEIACGLWHGVTSGVNSNPTLFDLLHVLSLSRTGASYRGGMTAYREFLINIARRLGAHIPLKTECRRIFVEKGRFIGVQVNNRGNIIAAGGGILGCSLSKAQQRVSYNGRTWLRRRKKAPAATGWKFTIALTVHSEAIPNGLKPRSVWQEEGAPALEMEIVDPATYSGSESTQSEEKLIYLRTVLPFTKKSLETGYQRLIAGRMVRQAMEIIPFLEFHVVRIFPDFRTGVSENRASFGVVGDHPDKQDKSEKAEKSDKSDTSEDGARDDSEPDELKSFYGFGTLEAVPDNLLVYQGKALGSGTGVDSLFSASEDAYPELGNLGPTVAALEAVAWVAHRSGLAGPFV